ncbi:MAG: CocE/NonD family hydrolase [Gemmatimonadetes bacterium]|nr:CocE/NonD family hydrolase [Gemmatimonadota bacterium]
MSHSITAAVVSLALLLPPPLTTPSPAARHRARYSGYSTATYDGYRRESRHVAMRDGIRLAVDLYRPTRRGWCTGASPVVWTHHRYNRAFMRGDTLIDYINGFGAGVDRLLRHGYVVAAVDARGAGASMGTQQGFFMPDEARDAYEITEWLAAQSWSTGRVGMIGRSYLGITPALRGQPGRRRISRRSSRRCTSSSGIPSSIRAGSSATTSSPNGSA